MSLFSRLFGKPDMGIIPFPPDSPEGLAARWVQWGASSKLDCNPIADQTGIYANAVQPDDVWFLAGCFGGSVERKCVIPANRKLFFPILNIWMTKGYESPDMSKVYGYLKLNGQNIELESIYTQKPFTVQGVWGNPVTDSVFGYDYVVGGLWKLLEPLPVGEHELYFRAGNGYGFDLEVTYYLTVAP